MAPILVGVKQGVYLKYSRITENNESDVGFLTKSQALGFETPYQQALFAAPFTHLLSTPTSADTLSARSRQNNETPMVRLRQLYH